MIADEMMSQEMIAQKKARDGLRKGPAVADLGFLKNEKAPGAKEKEADAAALSIKLGPIQMIGGNPHCISFRHLPFGKANLENERRLNTFLTPWEKIAIRIGKNKIKNKRVESTGLSAGVIFEAICFERTPIIA